MFSSGISQYFEFNQRQVKRIIIVMQKPKQIELLGDASTLMIMI